MSRNESPSMGLWTDLYQLTMAAGYLECGLHERSAVFHLFYRRPPFGGAYAVSCGLEQVIELVQNLRYGDAEIAYLSSLQGNDGKPLFRPHFLELLRQTRFTGDLHALPEGTLAFPHEPILRVTGSLLECQILETALLTLVNFQTLIATKASRVCAAAGDDTVLEFGLRRAQGLDGGLSASRAAYVGGCHGTSNVEAGRRFGIPIGGTHAHSWVMSFDSEPEAFRAYAAALPNNCTFLVDTYDTLEGVRRAIEVGHELRLKGHEMVGVRLDSGDLAELSRGARQLLDAAGFEDAAVVASSDLDEYEITALKQGGAEITVWGVGTRLATAYDQPALGGVYKLAAIQDEDGRWQPRIKLSERMIKTSNPGAQQVRRYFEGDRFLGDVIYPDGAGEPEPRLIDGEGQNHDLAAATSWQDLLVPIFERGRQVYLAPPLAKVREHAQQQVTALPFQARRFRDPVAYTVGLEPSLHRLKQDLIRKHRGAAG